VYDVSDKRLLEPVKTHHRTQYRLHWEIYDKESGNTFHKERFYEQPGGAFASFNWAKTEERCVSAEVYRSGTSEHSWVMLASFVNRPLRAAISAGAGKMKHPVRQLPGPPRAGRS
jgi:hypothetical protein